MGIRESRIMRQLIKTFHPNPSERNQLEYLVFSMGLLWDRLNPKKPPFLEIPRWKWWESVPAFQQEMLPPLYLAFIQWPVEAFRKEGQENMEMFKLFNKESQTTVLSAELRLNAAFQTEGSETYRKIMERFEVKIEDVPKIETEEQLSDAMLAWIALLNEHTWKDIIPGHPKIAVLQPFHHPELLPRKIIITDMQRKTRTIFDRLFSHFYVADSYRSEKRAKALFKFLVESGKLGEISDYQHKRVVTRTLLKPLWGKIKAGVLPNVLDVGCGDGFVGDLIEQMGLRNKVTLNGIDISPEMLDKLQSKGTYDSIHQLGIASSSSRKIRRAFRNQGFTDVILAFVDIYMSDYERQKAFKTIYDLLPVGGSLSLDVHHPDQIWTEVYRTYLEKAGFSRIELQEKEIPAKDGLRKVGIVFAFK